jgi:hypothetical protein
MSYAKVNQNTLLVYPYTWQNLQEENPYTNFQGSDIIGAHVGTNDNLSGNTIVQVVNASEPSYDESTQNCIQNNTPTLIENVWTLGWNITEKTQDEINAYNQQQINNVITIGKNLLQQTDWVEVPSVSNTSNIPHLVNYSDFVSYRNTIRNVIITPSANVVWPVYPKIEQWQTANGIVNIQVSSDLIGKYS